MRRVPGQVPGGEVDVVSEDSGLAGETSARCFKDAGCVEEFGVHQSHGCQFGFREAMEVAASWPGDGDMVVGMGLSKVLEHGELGGGAVIIEVGFVAVEG